MTTDPMTTGPTSRGEEFLVGRSGPAGLGDILRTELGVRRTEAKQARHPKSGWRIPVGHARRVDMPKDDRTSDLPTEGPPNFKVMDHAHFNNPRRLGETRVGTEPIKYVYRGLHEDEWRQAIERGHIHSDQRGAVIPGWEGTNAATDPRSAVSYLPSEGRGVVAKIRVHPDDGWFTNSADSYLRTREKIPLDRVTRVTGAFRKDEKGRLYHGGEILPHD